MIRRPLARALLLPAGLLTLATLDGRADPLNVLQRHFEFENIAGVPVTVSVSYFAPLVGVNGPVSVTTSIIGVLADGARDGASLSLAQGHLSLAAGSLTDVSDGVLALAGAGGAASFSGAGGAPGTVFMFPAGVETLGLPTTFGLSSTKPLAGVGASALSQSHFGAAVMDFSGDGATLSDALLGPSLAGFQTDSANHTLLGSTFSAVGLAGSQADSGSWSLDVEPSTMGIEYWFGLTGGSDTAALLGRQEIGGDLLQGTVLQLYPLASQTEVVDCGPLGCNLTTLTLDFAASVGDTYVFILRQEINAVPETNGVALVGFGILALGTTWWRFRRSRPLAATAVEPS